MQLAVDVLVVGDLNPDLLVSGDDLAPRWGQAERDAEMRLVLGGSAGICAAGMARIGLCTALAATVGDDDFGTAAQRMLRERGVSLEAIRVVEGARTGLSIHLLEGQERAIYTERGAMVELRAQDAVAAIAALRPRHVHLAAVFLLDALAHDGGRILDAAHTSGATVSVDTNFDPADRFDRPAWLRRADVLLPNETEALRLTGRASAASAHGDAGAHDAAGVRDHAATAPRGEDDANDHAMRSGADAHDAEVEAAARELAAGGSLVAVKRGARGAFAVRGGERAELGADALAAHGAPPVDAVGAGDSFDAGVVRALLDGLDLRETLALGCAAGTLSTRAAGGTAAQATHAEAQELAKALLR
ncbi:MAG TPA: carbohydrate kinase family protein [Conexibacter sp.]|jgi:sugar/nucleoside kinase (ribokinase family)